MNYVSLESVIEEVYQDAEYGSELDWGDCLTWAGQALRLIAAPSVYIEKVTGNNLLTPNITVTDYYGALPVDWVEVLPGGVRDADSKVVYEEATDAFFKASYQTGDSPHNKTGRKVYQIRDDKIFTEDATATLEMAYRAFKIDDKGFPMIPDNERVQQCIRTHITWNQDYRLWRKGKISREVYLESKNERDWYIGSAQNALRILSPERREIFTRHWTRLLPHVSMHDYSYAYLGNREDLNLGSEDTF